MGLMDSILINSLIEYWRKQNIEIKHKSADEIESWQLQNALSLPSDFKFFYSRVNGMQNLYPNEMDKEGFLFYPIESVLSAMEEFEDCNLMNKKRIYVFAEYMHKSWWYGWEILDENNYSIGIIPEKDIFKPITNSLFEFLQLYIEDSPQIYNH